MSLINDALRRAKDAHQQTPPPPLPPLPLRPVDPALQAQPSFGLLAPGVLVVVGLLALFFAWQWAQNRPSTAPQEVRALTPTELTSTPTPQPSLPAPSQPAPRPASPPSPDSSASVIVASNAASAPPAPTVADTQASDATNAVAVIAAPPKPAPLRLQAIIFNPSRPSALISGKTLFIGEKLGALRVVAIDQESATLVGPGLTNVLSLSK